VTDVKKPLALVLTSDNDHWKTSALFKSVEDVCDIVYGSPPSPKKSSLLFKTLFILSFALRLKWKAYRFFSPMAEAFKDLDLQTFDLVVATEAEWLPLAYHISRRNGAGVIAFFDDTQSRSLFRRTYGPLAYWIDPFFKRHFSFCTRIYVTSPHDIQAGFSLVNPNDEEHRSRLSSDIKTLIFKRAYTQFNPYYSTENQFKDPYYVHPTAVIDEKVSIGEGTRIWHFVHIHNGAQLGSDCVLGQNVYIGHNVRIGNHVRIQNNVAVYEGVELEDYVFCGPSMVFTNDKVPRAKYPQPFATYALITKVKEGASIGANATIICGVTLGRYCFIGAGAVVTKNIPDFAVVVGNPSHHIGWISEAGEPLVFDGSHTARCAKTGQTYILDPIQNRVRREDTP
jgi:UDP-2-acetamido-3-amino-2,3-dideoxy-glucuronate N-acetyltransferase